MIAGRRFLIVEDEFFIAESIRGAIEGAGGIVVAVASTVDEGRRFAGQGAFDAAVLDWNLDGKSGALVAEVVAGHGRPFLICTGYGAVSGEFADRPLLAKPFSSRMLVRALEGLFA